MSYIYNLGLAFQHIAHVQGSRTAIYFCDADPISFAELDDLSSQLAQLLMRHQVHQGDVVLIQNHKTAWGFASMLACLKLGAIYSNFDSGNPEARLAKIFETAKPVLILADTPVANIAQSLCHALQIPALDLSSEPVQKELRSCPASLDEPSMRAVSGANPAYLMFTSGSTGTPKGVVIRHDALLHFVEWCQEAFAISPADNLTNVNPIYFDNSVFDFYASLFNGAAFSAFPPEVVAHPATLLASIERLRCTFWFSVPSMLIYLNNLRQLDRQTFTTLRAISFGGEGYPKAALRTLFNLYNDRCEFFNVYGPTECTCMCSALQLHEEDFADLDGYPSLGAIAPNFDYLLLDESFQPANPGELYLGGPQLALGYYNDPERTRKSFVQNTLRPQYAQTLYKTGDRLELRSDGRLYFLGRVDNQIKHMGYRIELEEIEASLIQLPYASHCAVVHGKNKLGFPHLVAFLVGDPVVDPAQVRCDLKVFLPDYMIPTQFEFVSELPKNANGKVDRLQLKVKADLE